MPKVINTPEQRRQLEIQVELKRRGINPEEKEKGILEKFAEGYDTYSGSKMLRSVVGKLAGVEPSPGLEAPSGMDFATALDISEEPVMPDFSRPIFSDEDLAKTMTPEQIKSFRESQEKYGPGKPMSKRQMAAMGIENALDLTNFVPFTKIAKIGKAARKASESVAALARDKVYKSLAKYAKESKLNGIDPDLLGKAIMEENITPLISNPKEMRKVIQGRTKLFLDRVKVDPAYAKFFDEVDYVDIFSKKTGDGLVGKRADELTAYIKKASKNADVIKKKDLTNRISYDWTDEMMQELSGKKYSNKEIKKVEDLLHSYIKPKEVTGSAKDYFTLEDVHEMKKNIGKRLNHEIFSKPISKEISLENEVLLNLYRELKTTAEKLADTAIENGGKVITGKNQTIKGLMHAGDILADIDISQLSKPQKVELVGKVLAGTLTGGALGLATDSSYAIQLGALGGTIGASREAGKIGGDIMTRSVAKGAARISPFVDIAQPAIGAIGTAVGGAANVGAIGAVGAGRGLRAAREGGPMETPQIPYRTPQSIPEQIVRTKLPRTTEGIMNNRAAVLSKVAQQAPEMLPMFKDIFDNDPEVVKDVISMATATMPHFFEPDIYDRFDNVVATHRMDLARMDLMRDPTLSNTERIKLINELNKTSRMEYTPVKP